ncbi:hypothetical protein [Ureibacillus thermophilus]|uniref:Uncharacterized protein n=1 Tax=Ureibacillus thermophilus TaxID=367743 RepID=A0A4P6UR73_9BACL|nr:hypothetical protein [Ureibacillus thermophilus]QBK25759.1 hypothetical protein DKZ56_07705 [Ureibacillus thermophilus]
MRKIIAKVKNLIAKGKIFPIQKEDNRQLSGDNRHIEEDNRQSEELNRQFNCTKKGCIESIPF